MNILRKFSDWKTLNPGVIPEWSKRFAFRLLRLTSCFRSLPDYCIIGAQKSGTTSLYSYLALHSEVRPSHVKEINYYNKYYSEGISWYRAHFPVGPMRRSRRQFLTGEASTMYLYDERVPPRLYADLPEIKLLVVLRNPVDRAISHYHHRVRSGRESRSLEAALEAALERFCRGDLESGSETDYLLFGCYGRHLRCWLNSFPEEQFLVMQAESFFGDPSAQFRKVSNFLGICYMDPEAQRIFNSGSYEASELPIKKELVKFFEPHNRDLYSMPIVNFGWEN